MAPTASALLMNGDNNSLRCEYETESQDTWDRMSIRTQTTSLSSVLEEDEEQTASAKRDSVLLVRLPGNCDVTGAKRRVTEGDEGGRHRHGNMKNDEAASQTCSSTVARLKKQTRRITENQSIDRLPLIPEIRNNESDVDPDISETVCSSYHTSAACVS
ncbi:hypothetical protein F2P81_021665 [Scophthalmus maximus]|uniref:Uncharacterized protein n=1 Tax=Scophthalmus maximus TaxID=52904 RepID=A0A6A4S431_SCOMX|nr:hypothetical protein F2P81_021665 [Scophthalmus maximus]